MIRTDGVPTIASPQPATPPPCVECGFPNWEYTLSAVCGDCEQRDARSASLERRRDTQKKFDRLEEV